MKALVIVDVQNDFIDGTLPVKDAADIVPNINDLVTNVPFEAVFYTYDWHPENHISFSENKALRPFASDSPVSVEEAKTFDEVIFEGPPKQRQKLWPKHCVQNSWGAELFKDLKYIEKGIKIYKGYNPNIDSYSTFFDNEKLAATDLDEKLKERKITDVFVCGIATDVCINATTKHSLELGYKTTLIDDASARICKETAAKVIEELKEKGCDVMNTSDVKNAIKA